MTSFVTSQGQWYENDVACNSLDVRVKLSSQSEENQIVPPASQTVCRVVRLLCFEKVPVKDCRENPSLLTSAMQEDVFIIRGS